MNYRCEPFPPPSTLPRLATISSTISPSTTITACCLSPLTLPLSVITTTVAHAGFLQRHLCLSYLFQSPPVFKLFLFTTKVKYMRLFHLLQVTTMSNLLIPIVRITTSIPVFKRTRTSGSHHINTHKVSSITTIPATTLLPSLKLPIKNTEYKPLRLISSHMASSFTTIITIIIDLS